MTTNGPKPPKNSGFSNGSSKKPYSNTPEASKSNPEWNENESSKSYQANDSRGNLHGENESREGFKDKFNKGYEDLGDKVKGTFKNIQESEVYHYAVSNKEMTVTYILLALGIILLFMDTLIGGLLIGGVAGYHFAPQVVYYLRNIGQIFEGQDQLRYIVLTCLLIGLFIAAPGIFVGAVIVAVFRQLIFSKNPNIDRELANKDFKKRSDEDRPVNGNRNRENKDKF